MDPKSKWTFYVNKLYDAELQTKKCINDYRNYKQKLGAFRYENGVSVNQRQLFQIPPIKFIDDIFTAKARTQFCKLKIEFYKTITLEGENLSNREKLSNLEAECGKLLKIHGNNLA